MTRGTEVTHVWTAGLTTSHRQLKPSWISQDVYHYWLISHGAFAGVQSTSYKLNLSGICLQHSVMMFVQNPVHHSICSTSSCTIL